MCSFFLVCFVNPKSLEDGGEGGLSNWLPSNFLVLNFFLLDRLSKALAQLFLVCGHFF